MRLSLHFFGTLSRCPLVSVPPSPPLTPILARTRGCVTAERVAEVEPVLQTKEQPGTGSSYQISIFAEVSWVRGGRLPDLAEKGGDSWRCGRRGPLRRVERQSKCLNGPTTAAIVRNPAITTFQETQRNTYQTMMTNLPQRLCKSEPAHPKQTFP
ncbi:uncharacterized protein LOC122234354 isoform X7 [Panthera tigris]|uniref:uncharacterized protein LOC122234354 isoform X7 n=1 Tax=Panthera tigris TaxID=9694 RepID=UPI001C6F7557|nr:uncharacterized protein LOC122234354 isoform X7 [Panthera tigris]